MITHERRSAARLYFVAAIVTFLVAAFQITSFYKGFAESVSLFADTFHAGSDGITLLGTAVLLLVLFSISPLREERLHRNFTYANIGLLFVGVLLAVYELVTHAGTTLPTNWTVVVVAALGGLGDFLVWRILLRVKKSDLPVTLRTNHAANVLHIMQDMWQSIVVVVAGVAIRFGIPYVDTVLGSIITFLIFWEGFGLAYEEWNRRPFPYHFHLFGGEHKHDGHGCGHHHH